MFKTQLNLIPSAVDGEDAYKKMEQVGKGLAFAQIYIFTLYPGPNLRKKLFTRGPILQISKFTRDPNLHICKFTHDPNLHKNLHKTRLSQIQIYTKLLFSRSQIYTNYNYVSLSLCWFRVRTLDLRATIVRSVLIPTPYS